MKHEKKVYALPLKAFEHFKTALSEKSDPWQLIVAASWMDEFLKVKFLNEFSHGNSKAQKSLFGMGGAFSTFSAKIEIAFCAGWIEEDVYHDLKVIKRLRNVFAHKIEPPSFDDEDVRSMMESLRVPHREFTDWGNIRAATTNDGVVLYTDERPASAIEPLEFPAIGTFRLAIPIIITVLVANLDIPFTTDEDGVLAKIILPEYMELD